MLMDTIVAFHSRMEFSSAIKCKFCADSCDDVTVHPEQQREHTAESPHSVNLRDHNTLVLFSIALVAFQQ